MDKPNFFIVGAPKCGTTAMNDYLARHPNIFMARKELHYFGSDLKTKLKISGPAYLECFKEAANKKIIGEASVWYLFSRKAATEIKEFSPDAKILIMLRNPVQVMHALHSQHLYNGNETIADFETAVSLDEERNGNCHRDSLQFLELPHYKDSVLFAGQVKRYLDVFGKERVHIVLYEDLITDTKKIVEETLSFLGVDGKFEIKYDIVNANKKIRFLFVHHLIKKPSIRLKQMIRLIIPVKKIRHGIMSFLLKQNVSKKKREQMNDELFARLKESLRDDIVALGKIIDRDLSAWL